MKWLGVVSVAGLGLASLGVGLVYGFGILTFRAFSDVSDVDLSRVDTAGPTLVAVVLSLAGAVALWLAFRLARRPVRKQLA